MERSPKQRREAVPGPSRGHRRLAVILGLLGAIGGGGIPAFADLVDCIGVQEWGDPCMRTYCTGLGPGTVVFIECEDGRGGYDVVDIRVVD